MEGSTVVIRKERVKRTLIVSLKYHITYKKVWDGATCSKLKIYLFFSELFLIGENYKRMLRFYATREVLDLLTFPIF